jgi:hypothetical protein
MLMEFYHHHCHTSCVLDDPLTGVVNRLLGPDCHVICPLNFRMYLYSILVLVETLTVARTEMQKRV